METVDLRGEASRWDAWVAEVEHLAAVLPDGARRVTLFRCRMVAARGDEFLRMEPVAVEGVAVLRAAPGPQAVEFLAQLRAAARGR